VVALDQIVRRRSAGPAGMMPLVPSLTAVGAILGFRGFPTVDVQTTESTVTLNTRRRTRCAPPVTGNNGGSVGHSPASTEISTKALKKETIVS
jgi:hypothetical protein